MRNAASEHPAEVALERRRFVRPSLPGRPVELAQIVSWLLSLRGACRTFALRKVRRVLVVRLDELGDVVLTSPLLHELRRNLPEAWITLVVKPSLANLVERCPHVNQVLTYDREAGGVLRAVSAAGAAERVPVTALWSRRYDLAILPRWDAEFYNADAVVALSGACWRVGYSKVPPGILTHRLVIADVRHEAERGLDILRALGGTIEDTRLEAWTDPADEEAVDRFLLSSPLCGLERGSLAAIAPGARHKKRAWPLARYAEVGEWLAAAFGLRVVIVGSADEASLGRQLAQTMGGHGLNAMGVTSLRQTAALLRRCRLYVGGDTGPMHLAAATAVPVVEISCHPANGSAASGNSPRRFGPWGVPHRVLQPDRARPPCVDECAAAEAHCICGVTVEQVKAAITGLLNGRKE